MIPEPSKRPFGHPLPAEAIPYLVRPEPAHPWHLPFRDHGGNLVTWNGALSVRIRSALPNDIECSPTAWEATGIRPRWPDPDAKEDPGRWRMLDDVAGLLWKFPPRQLWIKCRDGITPNTLATVRVGAATVVPLALLQLCARLPRCRVRIDNDLHGHLQFLWRGGEAVIRAINNLPDPSFHLLKPRIDPLTRAYVYPTPR